jgi:hypothetical protein
LIAKNGGLVAGFWSYFCLNSEGAIVLLIVDDVGAGPKEDQEEIVAGRG